MSASNMTSLLSTALSKVKYRHSDIIKEDVLLAVHHYRDLIPKQDKFLITDGRDLDLIDLININGTIPVPYKGQNYNIPFSLWLLDDYPYAAPIAYVKPTSNMQIKVSKNVDHNGRIYLPYLHEWAYPNSNLLGLVQICIVTFSKQPPMFSKLQTNLSCTVQNTGFPGILAADGAYQQAGYPPYPQYTNNNSGCRSGNPPATNGDYQPYSVNNTNSVATEAVIDDDSGGDVDYNTKEESVETVIELGNKLKTLQNTKKDKENELLRIRENNRKEQTLLAESHEKLVNDLVEKNTKEMESLEASQIQREAKQDNAIGNILDEIVKTRKLLQKVTVSMATPTLKDESNAPPCYVCLEEMVPPQRIFQCASGHLICEDCKPRVPLCYCKADYTGRAIGLEKFLQDRS